ncbi:MAG TPA: penicillin-binding transpeptidase domain-containing protein [Gemmatimonadaceae bacterium]|nr:penicillin-binding transpeptidase domain-containing protein [Gemmatimonadaceae bacterium]
MIRDKRLAFIHAALLLFALALIGRAAKVQIVEHDEWVRRGAFRQVAEDELPAPRGRILDATGQTIAESKALVRIALDPRLIPDRARLRRTLMEQEVDRASIRRATDTTRKWVELRQAFSPAEIGDVLRMPGVHATDVSVREYTSSAGLRLLVGRTDASGAGLDGVEAAMDSLLSGTTGRRARARDVRGRRFDSPDETSVSPRPGHEVRLTINHALQQIADQALAQAIDSLDADGGDIVVVDPRSGEILAIASRTRRGSSSALTAITTPYEPGSTLKPFIAGGLLMRGLARPDEEIDTYDGVYTTFGRTIHDTHGEPRMTLERVIAKSSNVGIVRFAERLSPGDEYQILRDFGFGTITGLTASSESPGRLRAPEDWSLQSAASLAMGYEISVTPLQLALGYSAIANGGELLEPSLVQSIRTPDGAVVYENERRVVRRVLSPEVATTLRRMLADVVSDGTAVEADLASYAIGGKTGTARVTVDGRYERGVYNASFAGIFPLDNPQMVIVVKMNNPGASIYGGRTAAPVVRMVLRAAFAARDAALDPASLGERRIEPAFAARDSGKLTPDDPMVAPVRWEDSAFADAPASDSARGQVPWLLTLGEPVVPAPAVRVMRVVPDVRGMPLRRQVLVLSDSGFHVVLARGEAGKTVPTAGTSLRSGSLVRLYHP